MVDEKNMELAKQVYKTLCDALERREWTFEKEEEKLLVHTAVKGEDLPIHLICIIDAERQLIRTMSPLPFNICEEKRVEGSIAACVASFGMADGSFDYDIADGSVVFRMTASFRDSEIGEGLFNYLISCSCAMVDKYNDKFLALDKGIMNLSDFIEKA